MDKFGSFKRNGWREYMRLPCFFCEDSVTEYVEVIQVVGNRERKLAACMPCVERLKKLIVSMKERA